MYFIIAVFTLKYVSLVEESENLFLRLLYWNFIALKISFDT